MKRLMTLLLSGALLAACATQPPAHKTDIDPRAQQARNLDVLVNQYFEASLEMNPVYATYIGDNRYNDKLPNYLSSDYLAQIEALDREYLAKLDKINPKLLAGQDRLTYEIFRRDRQEAIEGTRFPGELIPVNQFFSFPNLFAQLGSGQSAQPFNTVEDYENFLQRIDGFVVLVDQAIANMRTGIERGVVQPRAIMEKVLPQLDAMVVSDPEQSLFYGPVKNMPESFSAAERGRLTAAYRRAVMEQLVPSYRKLSDFIKHEYLPKARETVGLSALPDGGNWYAYQVKSNTTTEMQPEAIHQLGLREVARIRGEMEKVMRKVGFKGSLQEFFRYVQTEDRFYYDNAEDLLQGYRDLEARMMEAVPELFSAAPKAGFEVRAVEAFRAESSAGASYQSPSADGSRPGIFYVNTFNLKGQPKFGMETLFIHEAIPGHHFQIALQQEIQDMPRYRRFGGYTAFAEGWALYAESIGKELGFFQDPMQWYGRLSDEMLRAMRLVVDTGLHYKGWSREQAIRYMRDNSSMADTDIVAEVERYIAIPGQALAYKIGQLKISELRARAERELGNEFDIREFHSQILLDGALPLDVLEAKVGRWIEAGKE